MFSWISTSYEKVICIYSEDFIHEPLEDLGGILESKGHPGELIEPKRCCSGSFWNVYVSHWYLVIRPDQVQLLENGGTFQGCGKVMQMGDGISVGYRGLVETSVAPKVSNHLTS